ncbi:MAG: PilZ domain-containing protein [Hyphomonas sp.]|uniref:PilZ domain-containing protein n=1 Tax=Hyphomonas sp. TaxID=87 RepID=UPI0017A713FE|nr:PilZ domain-containing protein [Hyphomonas sp.]MBU3921232.1 PilZ domain-containing protein [Alphaproteobacteria bacterium]MBA3067141.1 PilZ domain-containing protein [Hyphomonas sp.]MBU4063063.1 PilZ domain-containing protein [Alphaproteobacteria bacterium]MBU4164380.1 PilZ domain-containing protein [Alphaproteobacteria bacterium]MBU4568834.1 PilZ domain-containing protein [Alphaproteobacteria bacterium]
MSSQTSQSARLQVARINRRGQRIRVDARGLVKLGWFRKQEVEVRDVSPGGARLALPEGVLLPDEFELRIPQFKHPRQCVKRWECGLEIGVEFLLA